VFKESLAKVSCLSNFGNTSPLRSIGCLQLDIIEAQLARVHGRLPWTK